MIGGQHLFELLAAGRETEDGFGTGEDIDVVLFLELLGKMLYEGVVDVTSTEMTVVCGAFDDEMALSEGDDGEREEWPTSTKTT